jgi:dTMP kinase
MAFIVFEGGEGVGKSTQIELLFTALKQHGIACTLTREPGGTPFAENIRSLFKQVNKHKDSPLPLTELLLVSAARSQHIKKVIEPELQKGNFVLCDRFLDSTYVYQSIVGKIDKKIVDGISNVILQNLLPDLTFIFIADPKNAMDRINKEKKREQDRLDSFHSKMHSLIKEGYLEIIKEQYPYPNGKIPKRVLIHADFSIEEVFSEIKKAVFDTLGISI